MSALDVSATAARSARTSSTVETIGSRICGAASAGASAAARRMARSCGPQQVRLVEQDADAAPAQERVGLAARERQHLVAAEVDEAERDRVRRGVPDGVAVDVELVVLVEGAALREEEHLGPEQADALRAVGAEQRQLLAELDVGAQRDGVAVGRLGRARRRRRRCRRRGARSARRGGGRGRAWPRPAAARPPRRSRRARPAARPRRAPRGRGG